MNVKDFKEQLEDLPDDFEVCLSRYVEVTEGGEAFDVVLDGPIIGIAIHEETKEVRFVNDYVENSPPILGKIVGKL